MGHPADCNDFVFSYEKKNKQLIKHIEFNGFNQREKNRKN